MRLVALGVALGFWLGGCGTGGVSNCRDHGGIYAIDEDVDGAPVVICTDGTQID